MRALFVFLLLFSPLAHAQWFKTRPVTPPAPELSLPDPTTTEQPLTEQPTSEQPASEQPDTGQLRGIWVDAFGPGFRTPAEIDALIADAEAMNLNTLFVQVVRRGDCFCLRSSLPVAADPALVPGFDPLATLLERAHAAGLQVHAWVITLALWGSDTVPTDPAHAYNLHGPAALESWLTVRYDGETRPDGDVYLDPGVPAVADYLTEAVVSLAQNYDLDGVILDRLRYPDYNLAGEPSWGYNPSSLARFAAETGQAALPHPSDPRWTQWRREQLTLLARRLYLAVKQVDPALWVGAATIVYGAPPEQFSDSPAYSLVLQDWAGWLAGGFLDLNVPMNYKQNADADEAAWFGAWNRYAPTLAHGAVTAVAAGIYRNDPAQTQAQIEEVIADPALSGWSGYSYRTPSEGVDAGWQDAQEARNELAALLSAPGEPFAEPETFGRPAPVTALAGRVDPAQGSPAAQTVELLAGGSVVASAQTDAEGRYGFVLDPGEARAADLMAGYQVRLANGVSVAVPLESGRVTRAPTLTRTWYLAGHKDELSGP